MTELSRAMRNWPEARVTRTTPDPAATFSAWVATQLTSVRLGPRTVRWVDPVARRPGQPRSSARVPAALSPCQASAFAFSWSNSVWVMVPESSIAFACEICSAGLEDPPPATSRM